MPEKSFTVTEEQYNIALQGIRSQAQAHLGTEDLSVVKGLDEFIHHQADVISCYMAEVRRLYNILHDGGELR